jgi:hypothetical protein
MLILTWILALLALGKFSAFRNIGPETFVLCNIYLFIYYYSIIDCTSTAYSLRIKKNACYENR